MNNYIDKRVERLSKPRLEALVTFLIDIISDDSLSKTGQILKIRKLLEFYGLL